MDEPKEVTKPTEQDPFAAAATGYEAPKYPVLAADRMVEFEVAKSSIDILKDDLQKSPELQRKQLSLTLKTTKDYPDSEGKTLRSGFTSYKRIGLYEVRNDPDRRDRTAKEHIAPELAELLRGCGMGSRTPRDVLTQPSILEKARVMMKTSIMPAKGGFPEQNGLKVVPPA